MLYSSILLAATALSGFAVAQNDTSNLPQGIEPCCTVPADDIPTAQKREWCLAEKNTCREACGSVASGGNDCDNDSLEFNCECRNGTKLDMKNFEQSVPGQMCRFWFGQCINATSEDVDQQDACKAQFASNCGTDVTEEGASSSSSASSEPTASGTGGSSNEATGATSTGATESTSSPGAAAAFAQNYGTPMLAGGLIAFFGLTL